MSMPRCLPYGAPLLLLLTAATNDAGIAQVEVPGGTYEVCAWKLGYDLLSSTVLVCGDTTLHLEVEAAPEPEQPYWM